MSYRIRHTVLLYRNCICLVFSFIYKNFTPKRESHRLAEPHTTDVTDVKLKSLYKHALLHYHPDKQREYGEKWLVISEEICKCLNDRYSCFKGVNDDDTETCAEHNADSQRDDMDCNDDDMSDDDVCDDDDDADVCDDDDDDPEYSPDSDVESD